MRQLKLLTAVAFIGGTAVACTTYDSRVYDGYPTQYVMAPAPTYTQYVVAPAPIYSTGYTRHHVVASTYGPTYPAPLRVTEGHTPSAYVVTSGP